MKTFLKSLLLGVAGLAACLAPAGAADLYDLPPIYQDYPELVPVEVGSGWYLRGDVSYDFKSEFESRHREFRPDFETYGPFGPHNEAQYDYFDAGERDWEIDAGANFAVGVGYQFTDFFRGDLTAHYWKHDLSSGKRRIDSCYEVAADNGIDTDLLECDGSAEGELQAWELMANGYVDLGTIAGFTPYVGGGLGAVRLDYRNVETSGTCHYDGDVCYPDYYDYDGSHESEKDWRFAYALMAGAAYDLTRNLKLDVGYRYLNVDGGDMYGFDERSRDFGADGAEAEDDGFDRHTIQAGIRYSIF